MNVRQVLSAWRRRWVTIALVALFIHGLVAMGTAASPKVYSATSQLFVSVQGASSSSDLVSGSTYAQSQVQSYIDVVTAPVVLEPIIRELDLQESPADLKRRVTVTVPEGTVLLDVEVRDSDPVRAADIGNAISAEFAKRVASLESTGRSSTSPVKVSVLRLATPRSTPVSPTPARNMMIGAVLGLLLGLAVALIREATDTSLRSKEDVERLTDLPVIGSIPLEPAGRRHPASITGEPSGIRAEALRTLRTNLQFVQAGGRLRSFVVTSSVPGEGKTTTVAQLARVLAAAGTRVCVIEGDLRRPGLLDHLGLEGSVGLTNILIGEITLEQGLQDAGDNLAVLGAGPTPPNPSELLGSRAMESLIIVLEEQFDIVLVDTPPVQPVTDAAVLSRVVGGVIVCVGIDVADRESLTNTLQSLEAVDSNVLGLVINRAPRESATYSEYSYEYSPAPARSRSVKPTKG